MSAENNNTQRQPQGEGGEENVSPDNMQLTPREKELVGLDTDMTRDMIAGMGTLIQYALDNITQLVVDKKTGAIVRKDAFDLLMILASRRAVIHNGRKIYPDPSEDEFFDVLEYMCANKALGYNDIEKAITQLPAVLRSLVQGALGAARQAVSSKPDTVAMLAKGRENLILDLLYQNKQTRKAYDILVVRPHLLKFLSDYALLNLGIKLTPAMPSRDRIAQARIVDFSTRPPRVFIGGKEERPLPFTQQPQPQQGGRQHY